MRRPPHTEEIKPQSVTGVFLLEKENDCATGSRGAFEGLREFLKCTLQALHWSFFQWALLAGFKRIGLKQASIWFKHGGHRPLEQHQIVLGGQTR